MTARQPTPLRLEFHLLDRQIVGRDGLPIGKCDDLELADPDGGPPVVTHLLVGQRVLGERVKGALGRVLVGLARRLGGTGRSPVRIPYHLVDEVGSQIRLTVAAGTLTEAPLEAWLRDHLISRLPGARHADQ
ncbi:MAG TPA: hypothetical protein VF163_12195 [Micromonosporaceae bacterium]